MAEAREIVVRIQLEYPPVPPAAETVATDDRPILCKVSEVARLLAVGESTVNELIARNELESLKIGASRRIARAEVEAYVKRLARKDGQ